VDGAGKGHVTNDA
jgi:hypothetical protein